MISNNEIKLIRSLQQKKFRKREGLFVVEGLKSITELSQSKYEIHKVFLCKELLLKDKDIINDIAGPFEEISRAKLSRISNLKSNSTGLAVVKIPPLVSPKFNNDFITLVLDGIRDPGNLGTIIRIADWYGIGKILASVDTCDLYNPKVLQASMGSFLRVDLAVGEISNVLANRPSLVPVLGAFMDGENIHNFRPFEHQIVVIGSESHGISETVEKAIDRRITIPRFGKAESLNAGIATAVICDNLMNRRDLLA
jgi:TrmH family RNA methyltransferase